MSGEINEIAAGLQRIVDVQDKRIAQLEAEVEQLKAQPVCPECGEPLTRAMVTGWVCERYHSYQRPIAGAQIDSNEAHK